MPELPTDLRALTQEYSSKYAVYYSLAPNPHSMPRPQLFSVGCSKESLRSGVQSAILRQPAVRRALQLPMQSSEAGTVATPGAASSEAGSIDQLFLQVRIETSARCMLTSELQHIMRVHNSIRSLDSTAQRFEGCLGCATNRSACGRQSHACGAQLLALLHGQESMRCPRGLRGVINSSCESYVSG